MINQKPLILIVDDEQNFREILRMGLTAANFEVMEAADGETALEILKTAPVDIILLDIMMPKMDGTETLFKIKSEEKTRRIRIIILTGKGDPREEIVRMNRKFAQESGAVEYLRKETEVGEIVNLIKKFLVEDGKLKAEKGQVMLLTVMVTGGLILTASVIGGLLMLYQVRQSTDIINSTKAIFAADAGLEWDLYQRFVINDNSDGTFDNPISFSNGATVKIIRNGNTTKSIGTAGHTSRAFEANF